MFTLKGVAAYWLELVAVQVIVTSVRAQGDSDDDRKHKKYILYFILIGLILFLVLTAFIIETLLSKSKKNENRIVKQEQLRNQFKEKTQIESHIYYEPSNAKRDNTVNHLKQPIFEENENSDKEPQ